MKYTKPEEKLLSFLLRYYRIFFFIAVTLIGLKIRWEARYFESADILGALIPWFHEIQELGQWKALGTQVGDYNILYQTLIALGTYLTDSPNRFYKGTAILSDLILALSCAYMLTRISRKSFLRDNVFYVAYACVFLLPIAILDSAYWGQCDSLYTLFLMWTLYLLYEKKFCPAFLLYGIAFAFKLQSVFLLPFILILYLSRREFSLLNFLYSLVSFWLSGIGGYLNGRSLLAPFEIYMKQSSAYHSMYLNCESFWKLMCPPEAYEQTAKFAILFTIALLGLALYAVLTFRAAPSSFEDFLRYAVWVCWTMLLFLPAMHERYTYPLDILLVLLTITNVKYALFAFFEILTSLNTYGYYLFQASPHDPFFTLIQVGLWFAFTARCYRSLVGSKGDFVQPAATAGAPIEQ